MNFLITSTPTLPLKTLAMVSLLGIMPLATQAATPKTTTAQAPVVATTTAFASEGVVTDGIIAMVNDNVILQSQLNAATQQAIVQLKAQNQPIAPSNQLYAQVLDQLIMEQIQLDMVKRIGIKVDDNQVNNALLAMAKQNGFTSVPAFQQALDQQRPGSYQTVRQHVSDQLSIKTLQQQQLARRVKISDQDVALFLNSPESNALKQSQYHTIHVRVPFDTSKPVTDKQRKQALAIANRIATGLAQDNANVSQIVDSVQADYPLPLQGGDMGTHNAKELPTELANDILAMKTGDVSKPLMTPEGINVIKLVEKRDDQRQIIDQWSVRHILVSPSANLSPEMAKQRIDTIYEQLRKGSDFATLAATYSDDPGSASKGGSLGWVSEGEMVPEFEKVMKNTEAHDYSAPFSSQFGYHILKVDDKRKQDVTDIYQKNMAREILYKRLAPQALEDWLQEIRVQAYVKVMEK